MGAITYNETKFRELILYVAERMGDDASFGATVLNKALFFSDFFAYAQFGEPVTGAEYQKLKHGPAPRRLLPVQQDLVGLGEAQMVERPYLNHTQKRLVALRDADVSLFGAVELKLVEQVIDALRGARAVDVSDLSHRMAGWQFARLYETIPYNSVFVRTDPMNDDDIRRGQELAAERGWAA